MNTRKSKTQSLVRHEVCLQHHEGRTQTVRKGKYELPPGQSARNVRTLPLIITRSQWVKFRDQYFFLRREGLYRFWDWGKAKYSRRHPQDRPVVLNSRKDYSCVILYRGDVLKLIGAVASLHVHGKAHQALGYSKQLMQMKRGCVSLTCGYMATFLDTLFRKLGIQGRLVAGMRLEGAYNTYDNGHSLNEIYSARERKWILVDADMGQVFLRNGRHLNLYEVSELIRTGRDFDLQSLMVSDVAAWDSTSAVSGKFPDSFFSGGVLGNGEYLKQWYRRILRVPLIRAGDGFCFLCENPRDRNRILRYSNSYQAVHRKEWLRRFYS